MPTVEALVKIPYAGRHYQPGEVFEATEKHARILYAIGKAKPGERKAVELPKHIETQPVVDAKEILPAPLPEAGLYQRRDMRAGMAGRIGGVAWPSSSQVGQVPEPQTSTESDEKPKRPGGSRSRKT